MKFFHLSDLHIGIRFKEYSLLEDQRYIFRKILDLADSEKPEAVVIAGDIYDKPSPPSEAVAVFDDFLSALHDRDLHVLIISGNHDSPQRIAFGSRFVDPKIHLSPAYDGSVKAVRIIDRFGEVCFYLLPFVKPSAVRPFFPDEPIASYTDAIRTAITHMDIDPNGRNVLVAHQFVTGAQTCDSEDISVGGAGNVDSSVFALFDYVALGHLHGPQSIAGNPCIRYCGTPLKYSFSEKSHTKSVTVVEMEQKGTVATRQIPLIPLHDMREIRGTYNELTLKQNYSGTAVDDYLHAVLTDESDIPNALARLRTIYPNILALDYDNKRTRSSSSFVSGTAVAQKSDIELFMELYEKQNGQPMSEEQKQYSIDLFEQIKEGDR
ncbi:MAG: exonuclease SbcCD subunit D [Clostridia bacterium]|nr:exonuclease SbcCD subunit D [Clostridia bacterium]